MQEDVSTVGASLEDAAEPSSRRELVLVVMEQRALSRYQISGGAALRIGRAEDCDVVLRDALASRQHALLHVEPRLELEDLGSRNGISLNNQALSVRSRVPIGVGQ